MTEIENDGLSDLMGKLALKRSGWHRQEHPQTGAIAYFPVTATDVDAWEQRALSQAQESERMERETRPEPKPAENTFVERRKTILVD